MKIKILCMILCISALLTITSSAASVFVDGFERREITGYNTYYYAKQIKFDKENNNAYVFDKWTVEGVEVENKTDILLSFVAPSTDVYLTTEYSLLGDTDKDDSITAIDVFYILQGMKNGSSDKALDINLDGVVSAADKLCLLSIIKGTYDYSELYYSLQVEGKEIMKMEYAVSDTAHELYPFFAIWDALGAELEWEDKYNVKAKYNDSFYTLNIWEMTFYRDERNEDYDPEVDGGTNYFDFSGMGIDVYDIRNDDLYVDRPILNKVFRHKYWGLNTPIAIRTNHDTRTITIDWANS